MYRWFNVPASSDPKSPDNPLNHIRAHAKVEDYVLLKLDIDNNEVEEAIVNSMLRDPEVRTGQASHIMSLRWVHGIVWASHASELGSVGTGHPRHVGHRATTDYVRVLGTVCSWPLRASTCRFCPLWTSSTGNTT